jgi:two-component system sensor histidine kinase DctS
VRVEVDCTDDLPHVLCDRTMVEQILLNLARNGMQAMDRPECKDRSLVIHVKRAASNAQQSWLEFIVADQGSGIDPAVADQLFTPFFTTKAEGMGLGLSLCRTVVEQHGGHMGFEANSPSGTLFRFTLPGVMPGQNTA